MGTEAASSADGLGDAEASGGSLVDPDGGGGPDFPPRRGPPLCLPLIVQEAIGTGSEDFVVRKMI